MQRDTTIAGDQLQAALSLARQGIPVGPLRAKSETLKSGVTRPPKSPKIADFAASVTTDEIQIRRWWKKWPDAMPGTATGRVSGLAVLDLDQRDGKDGMAALTALGLDPDTLSPCIVETPSGGRHLYFRWPEGLGCSAVGLPPGVDVRGQGGVIALPGAVSGKGAYRLTSGSLAAEGLPEWPEALQPRRKAAEGTSSRAEPSGYGIGVLRSALMAIPIKAREQRFGSDGEWFKVIRIIHDETGGSEEGRELAHEWSKDWGGYDPDQTDQKWDRPGNYAGERATIWTIIAEAERHGWDELRGTEIFDSCFTPEELAQIERLSEEERLAELRRVLDPEAWALIDPSPKTTEDSDDLVMLTPDQCALSKPQPYVIKGLIARGNMASVVGAPGVGKSVLVPHLAYAVAQGRPVFGMRTRPGRVFYVAAENEADMQLRVRALQHEHGHHGPDEDFRLVLGGAGAFKDAVFMRKLRAAIKRERPSLIVVDTLAAAMPGFEENSSEGMGGAIAAIRSLTRWGAAVLIVHHDTKAGDGLPRGHSSLHGIVDMSLALLRTSDGYVTGSPSKNRNGRSHVPLLAYSIRRVALGTDDDGDDIATVVCDEEEASTARKTKTLTPSAEAALAILVQLAEGGPVAESDWRSAAKDGRSVSAAEKPDNRRRTFKRAVEELLRAGKVQFQDGLFSTGKSAEEVFTDDMV